MRNMEKDIAMVKKLTKEMLWEVGTQFGHQSKKWNPKMKPYIYGKKYKVHIIDLQKTIIGLDNLKTLMDSIAEKKGKILFVGTKKSAKGAVKEAAERTDNFYVNERWLGGTLTNLKTIHLSIKKLWDIERKEKTGYYEKLTKKEASLILKQKDKLENLLGGIKHMRSLPSALFVVDPKHEIIAVKEAQKLNIPIIGICDTNSDPDLVDYVIPGNDDIYRSVSFLTNHIAEIYADACKMDIPPAKPVEKWKPKTDQRPNNRNGNFSYRTNNYDENRRYESKPVETEKSKPAETEKPKLENNSEDLKENKQ